MNALPPFSLLAQSDQDGFFGTSDFRCPSLVTQGPEELPTHPQGKDEPSFLDFIDDLTNTKDEPTFPEFEMPEIGLDDFFESYEPIPAVQTSQEPEHCCPTPCTPATPSLSAHSDHLAAAVTLTLAAETQASRGVKRGRKMQPFDVQEALFIATTATTPYRAYGTKTYKASTPAKFCHLCARKASAVRMAVCGNLAGAGTCRKVICQVCFEKHGWDFEKAVEVDGEGKVAWICFHCEGQCPEKAMCSTYKKTNFRRYVKKVKTNKQYADPAEL